MFQWKIALYYIHITIGPTMFWVKSFVESGSRLKVINGKSTTKQGGTLDINPLVPTSSAVQLLKYKVKQGVTVQKNIRAQYFVVML